jgi:CheY-like chemotaxis protein
LQQIAQQLGAMGWPTNAIRGYGSDEDRLKTREAGFDAHLTKPADPGVLQELLAAP